MAVQGRSYTFAISFRNGRGWRVCGLPPFDRNLAHWSQLGPAGTFSTSFVSWGSTQRGKGMVRISVNAIARTTREWREWEGRAEVD